MSGTQYSEDSGLINELNAKCRPIAFDLSLNTPLKHLFEFKYTKKDTLKHPEFSKLELNDQFLIINALIVYRLSCIDYVFFFDDDHIDFILTEYIRAYEDYFHLKQHSFFDLEEEMENNYPSAHKWLNLVQSQARMNERFGDVSRFLG